MSKKPGPKVEPGVEGKMANVTYTVDDMTRRMLKVLGGGNESKGLRAATRTAYHIYQRTPISVRSDRTPTE
jgi:hypothetical protein